MIFKISKTFVVCAFLLLLSVTASTSDDIWEFIFGPRLGNKRKNHDYQLTPEKIVRQFGYRLDTHQVASSTGHILTLHRIPRGHKKSKHEKKTKRPIAFIHHGLLGSSDMWLVRGPTQDLPYLLADFGYDVWMFNIRGNVYSRKHKTLNPDKDVEYWDFGIEEIGYYDLPVAIDYILNITSQTKIYFIGHSIGVSTCLIMCSMKPEYNDKIQLIMGLGPLAFVKHPISVVLKVFFSMCSLLVKQLATNGIFEILPRREQFSKLGAMICRPGQPMQSLCISLIVAIVGEHEEQINMNFLTEYIKYYPSGTSIKVILNVIQYFLTGKFARFDYGSRMMNFVYYNSSITPNYNLSLVTTPVSLHYGQSDVLVNEQDINELASQLPNMVGKFPVPNKNFNHFDFVIANNSKTLLYDTLLNLMDKYK